MSSKIDDGGPAFPNVDSDERVGVYVGDRGMTLRDFFAAAALTGIVASGKYGTDTDLSAETAYKQADSMLKKRAERPTDESDR